MTTAKKNVNNFILQGEHDKGEYGKGYYGNLFHQTYIGKCVSVDETI